MKTRSRAKTIYTYAVHMAFWLGTIGFAVFNIYNTHNFAKQQIVDDAISAAFAEGYTQVTFRSVTIIQPRGASYYACGSVNGQPAVYDQVQLLVLGRDPAAAYRLRRLCESGRSIIL